ncbi:16S rRNA (uracil(1498)-N(3))-methyltransferase [Coxiella burnetii]|uniref:Ribosomal RNA small subunit methyltransferase E n=1 Tax=Coxiella burnetii (strain RSA 493 / Nine Mile phase I) TaxID=227377 RepID=Q83AE1_COXBU|nr:16S rRNA (uracil(1498)-N(3))-methyltransferase [Coxiella burnetii]NP_820935.2 hypothetical protein CBU_1960 [Coxiella burnetii RSA 493]AAO91449.2 hypothetical cytosolic protein [Coxiella burnetii RSA 493]ARI66709.1 16S rRNA (uracil(1498)-N(3))-methyltransferase [Coxiella burnetii]AZV74767.1 16S rRNA (uracil(1498)-N(3))-methyltransferase [Coxiella burnetii]MCF2094757.1 16S rRNA (uracil(1498)-N(3))-methyltransferase [Coxiella burnetii]MCF2096796.1 16S rRNA (uracil(1498)-N(3))-methyltransfera
MSPYFASLHTGYLSRGVFSVRIQRIYYPDQLSVDSTVTLDSRNYHYLLNVLRLREGHKIILFNGDGNNYGGRITRIQKKQVEITIDSKEAGRTESSLFIELGQGISRSEKMDYAIQKAVELGVNRIVPLITERTSTKPKTQKLAHWQGVLISGCEQSGRCCIPELMQAQSLSDWLSQKREGLSLVCHPNAQNSLADFKTTSQRITLLIGPEGGLSDDEVQRATQSGFQVLFLGPRILRTETATVTALSLIQAYFGDLQRL